MAYIFILKGTKDYKVKHPIEYSSGWNVIFNGLNEKKEPLFLGAFSPGGKFSLTLSEYKKRLIYDFNSMPDFSERKNADFFQKKNIGELSNFGTEFDLDKLLEVIHVDKLRIKLHSFILKNAKINFLKLIYRNIFILIVFFLLQKILSQKKYIHSHLLRQNSLNT